MAFGWLGSFMLLIAGYYVLRFQVRRRLVGHGHPQSLFIAGLTLGWPLFVASVVGVVPRTLGLALALTGAAFATVFLVTVVEDLRRNGNR